MQQNRQGKIGIQLLIFFVLFLGASLDSQAQTSPPVDLNLNPQFDRATAFGGVMPEAEGKLFPYIGTVESLPIEPSQDQVDSMRRAFEDDGAILVPSEDLGERTKPLIVVIDTPTKITPVSPKYSKQFNIQRIVLEDSLITRFQRSFNNQCAVFKMCFHEFDNAPLKFARILAPMAGVTAALKGAFHPAAVTIATLTVQPALFAVWQTLFMTGYTHWKSRYSPGLDAWFAYSTLDNPTKRQRTLQKIGYFFKSYVFDLTTSLLINVAAGSPNEWWKVVANSLFLDVLANFYSTMRGSLIDRAAILHPELKHKILSDRRNVVLADKTILTPITLVMRSLFSLGVVSSAVPMVGGVALYSGMSLYRLIRGTNGVVQEVQTDSAVRRLDRFEKTVGQVWKGLWQLSIATCSALLAPESSATIGQALEYFDARLFRM